MAITGRQEKILEIIDRYLKQNGYPPSLRNIADTLGGSAASTVLGDIRCLVRDGYLYSTGGRSRAYLPVKSDCHPQELVHINVVKDFTLPAESRRTERIMTVPRHLVSGSTFAYVMKGNFLIKKGIFDGDVLFFDETAGTCSENIHDGDIVAADADGFPVVGIYSGAKGFVILKPANEALGDICPDKCLITGKMVFLQRFLRACSQPDGKNQ